MADAPPRSARHASSVAALAVLAVGLVVASLVTVGDRASGEDPRPTTPGTTRSGARSAPRDPAPARQPTPGSSTTTEPEGPPVVLVIGDSLTVQSTGTLRDRSTGLDLRIHAAVRTTIGDWLPRVPGLLARNRPEVAVVALGTNDNWPANSGEEPLQGRADERRRYRGQVRAMLEALRSIPCVVWVEPAEVAPMSEYLVHAADHGAILRAELARADAHAVDWTRSLERGGAFERGWMQEDGIHLRAPGQVAFATVTLEAVRSSC